MTNELVVNPQTGDIIPPSEPMTLAEQSQHLNDLAVLARTALSREGAVVKIQGGRHITIRPLSEIAAYLHVSVSCTTSEQPYTDPLTNAPMARTVCSVISAQGVEVVAVGVCSAGEQMRRRDGGLCRRWTEWHAVVSMSETRAKVRALAQLLAPVITLADDSISLTPSEIMPEIMPENIPATSAKQSNRQAKTSRRPKMVSAKKARELVKVSRGEYTLKEVEGVMTAEQADSLIAEYEEFAAEVGSEQTADKVAAQDMNRLNDINERLTKQQTKAAEQQPALDEPF